MGHAWRQFQALLWKNWLCRLRHPVLSLAEFFWPCILFMILTVLRFQEPPRHRESCYLQARDLPSRGVLPFVQALLCNTGSSCRNISFESSMDHHFRLSRFQTATDNSKVSSLAFLKEIQDLAEEILETTGKAKKLQKLWLRRSETPGTAYGSSFLTMDLNKTEDVISKLESLHQQPHIWDFLRSLPRLHTTNARLEDRLGAVTHFLQAGLNSLTSLGDLDWLPLNQTIPQVFRHVLNATISSLRFLQHHRTAVNETIYHLSLQNMVWDPQKVQSDLESQFGFNDHQLEHILNYSAELKEIPTHSFLERMVCSILSNTSADEAESQGYRADCHPKWSAVKNYIIHAVSWLKLYGQVFDQWQQDGLLQNLLAGASHSLVALRDQLKEESESWKVVEALHAVLLILSDSLAVDGPRDNHLFPQIFQHLGKLQRALSDLSPWPALKRLPLLDTVLRNMVAWDLHFVQEVLSYLKTSARDFIPDGSDGWRLEMDMFFWGLKQLLTKNASTTCLNGHLSQEAPLPTGDSSIWKSLWGMLCHTPAFNETSVLNELLHAVKDAGHSLQEVIAGHTDGPVAEHGGHLGWQDLGTQLSEVSFACSQVFQLPGADASPEKGISDGGCERQLVSTVVSHILEEVQISLQQMSYWKIFSEIIRKTCELVQYVNEHGSFQNSLLSFSEDSPCYPQNMDWKLVVDNYFVFFNNLKKSPITFITKALNFTKHHLVVDNKLYTLENGKMNILLSCVEFLEELLLSIPSGSFTDPESHNLSSLAELLLNRSILWIHHLKSLEKNPHDSDAQKLLKFEKLVIEKLQSLKKHRMRKESKNILRFIELILLEINPELREFWLNSISQEERANIEILPTLVDFSVPEYENILGKIFNFFQSFHSGWPKSPAMNADFIRLSEAIVHGLYEFSFLTQEQVSIALDTIYALQNMSKLFTTLSEPQKQELNDILTHIYMSAFKDRDTAALLQTYSSLYQYLYKFLNILDRQSLITYLTQISRQILDLIKRFNIQNINKALLLLSETTEALGTIPEVSYCQQLFSILNFLEIQAQSLVLTEGIAQGVIHASLTGLKQLFAVDEGFRVSLLQYVNQFFNGTAETQLPSECFILENATISSVIYSRNEGSSLPFSWTQVLSNLSLNGSVISEFTAIHCTLSWIQTWTEIWGSISQIFKLDLSIFTPLHVGITQLLDELETDGNISKNCQGIVPTYHTARVLLNLFKNVTQENGFHDWDSLLHLRDLWVALSNELVAVQSLNLDQIEKSFITMETSLHQLKTFPMKTNASKEFLYSLFDVFIELSKASDYVDRNMELINNFLSNDLTDHKAKFASVITELRKTILFLKNVSEDRTLLSCASIFQSVTELIFKDNLLPVNTSKKQAHILAMLSSIFSSKNISSSLEGCIAWVDLIDHLCMMYNSSSSSSHSHSMLGSFEDMENKMNSALKILTWVLSKKVPICPLNESNINCVNIYLKDITDFLNIIVTTGLEKEKVPKFEILLALFNDSTKQVDMIITNLTKDLDFASQYDWKHFKDLLLRPIGMSDDIHDQFQNIWQHIIALGKEMQKLLRGIFHNVLRNNSSSDTETMFTVFSTSPKEKDINHLGNSVYQLANFFALNITNGPLNSSEVVPYGILKAVGLGIQLARDVFNSLMPAVHFNIPRDSDHAQVLKKVTSLMHSLKKADVELLVGQFGQIAESLMNFFKNLSRSGIDSLGVDMLVGLVEKFVDSSHSWSVSHLLRLSRLLPKEVVNTVLDVYYALPHIAGLLQRVTDKNITESLKDVYNFTLLHGITMFNITKEDFADVIKTLLDTVELVSDEPAVVSEVLLCLPKVWCSNHTTFRLEENLKVEGCNVQEHRSSSFYHMVTRILDLLHLPPPSDSQCINENSEGEITRKVVCVIHELADWNSILLELLEIFHIKNSFVKTLQGFWHEVLPFVSPSGSLGIGSTQELCPSGPIKQAALQIIEKLKYANFTKLILGENILDKLGKLDKILNITKGTEKSVQKNVYLNLERIFKLVSAVWSLGNSAHYLLSPIMVSLNANLTDRSSDALSSLMRNDKATYDFEELWLDFKQPTKDPASNLSLGQLLSDINKKIQGIALQNTTMQLSQVLKILDSSPPKTAEIIEGFLFLTKHWLHEYENEDYLRLMQRLLNATASENSTDVTILARDLTTYLDYLRNSSKESNFDAGFFSHMLNQEQLTDFSAVQLLLESIVMNSVRNFAELSQESAPGFSGTYFQIMDFINLILNHIQSKNGGEAAGITEDFLKQLLEILLLPLLNGMPENKISLLLKDFRKDVIAEMSFVPRDKILEVLKLDPFLTWMNENSTMNIFSSLKTIYHLIKNSFSLNNREVSGVLTDFSHTHPRESMVKTDTQGHLDFFTVVTQFLSQFNNSENLSEFNQNLRSVLHRVQESSADMATIMDILLYSPTQACRSSSPLHQHTMVAKLTDLLSVVNSSFPLRKRETLESTMRLFGAISQVGKESHVLAPALEISRTLTLLVNNTAELAGLASSVDSVVRLLNLAKKVSKKITTMLGNFSISSSEDSRKFFDILYSIMLQNVQHNVKQVTSLKKVDPFLFQKTKDLLIPFLDLAFGMMGVTPNTSEDSDILSVSSIISSYVSPSKDFSEILEEMAENLISIKIGLRDLEYLAVVVKNRTQNFSLDAVNLWEEILDCLVPMSNITNQMDFLKLQELSSTSHPQVLRKEGSHDIIHFLDVMLTDNSTERETFLKMVINLTLQALWNGLKEDNWDIFNLLLTFSQHPNDLLNTIESVVEASSEINSDYGDDLSQDLFSDLSWVQNTSRYQLAKSVLIGLSRIALSREELPPNNTQWTRFMHTLFFSNSATDQNVTAATDGKNKEEMMAVPHSSEQMSYFQKFLKALFVLIEHWQRVPQADQSVFEMCQVFRQLEKPSEAVEMLHRVEMMALRVLIIFAENPSLTKDILCATLSCQRGGMRHLILSAVQGVTLLHHHYQEIGKIWSSPNQLDCEDLSRSLSSALEGFKSKLENASDHGCTCQPLVGIVQQHMHRLTKSLEETWMSKIPVMTFLSNFTVTEDIKIKDLMKNVTKLTKDLRSSFHISEETIHSILEANISHSKVLSSVLTVALSGKCDDETLHLLLTFPESEKSWFAMKELCSLPGSQVFSLLVVMGQNLNLRNFVYKTLIPSEANGLLKSLLDVISSLSSILVRAQHALEYLPEFLHTFKITTLLDMPDFQQVFQNGQGRSSAFSSFQSVMKLLCKNQESFLSNSNMFVNLPRVNELLEDDKEKFNIPHDSTPFCLKLYQEILQSPNGALVWSFLKPVLHGKILYTPNSPEINEVIQKANYTFYFVDKIKILSETLLKMSSVFQGSGNGRMFSQLQDALRNKFIRNFVESQLHIDTDKLTEDLQTYGRMLDKMFNHVGAGHFQFLGGILANLSSCVVLDRFQAVETVATLETKAHELMKQNSFLASVIFNSSLGHRHIRSAPRKLPPHVTYTIRTNVLYSMRTDMIKNPSWKFHPQSLPADGFKYNYIFVPLQDMIERAIIAVQTGQEALEPTTQAQAAPYPCHTSDLFLNNVGFFFPLIMMLTWMVSVASMVRKLVYEREIQIEEYMRMMGLHPAIHFLSWFLENMAMLALSSAALAAILKMSGIFMHSDAFIIFLFLLDFGVSAVMLSYFLSVFFNQANTAALCTSLGYMISFLPYVVLLVLHNQLSFAIQTLLCLLSTTAFGQGVFFITFLEGQEEGIQWNHMYRAPEPGGMTFGWVCWMILFDSILYFLCGWYFSNLVPGTFGLGKPWYFPFTVSYWKTVCGMMEKRRHSLSSGLFFFNEDSGNKGFSQQNCPGELEGGNPGVALISVTKEYEGHKLAVQELTLTFHQDQITALLGTNGAGKTTIISMLMGLYPPTSGTIMINGKNLQTDLSKVREELGVCPQQDVLLDNLTVQEHLMLFGSIKAPWWTKKELQQQVNKTLDEVELTQHRHKPARVLSGGMKRKLSIGIAFMGMSKTVVLDEPSSGVDPCSRRSLWDILLKYREGRTIIFTTHHLDEAEMLSDHVAVLQQGRLRCYAPPAGLKETYGQGLTLTLTKQPSVLESQDPMDLAHVTSLIQVYIPQAFLKDSSGGELTYTIPKDADKTCFKGLCQALDQNLQPLHLTGYGISDTTLEEVFLMLLQDTKKKSHITPETKLETQNERPAGPSSRQCGSSVRTPPARTLPEPMIGFQLLWGQAAALLRKRLLRTLRAWKSTTSDLLLPVLFVALAMGLFMVQPLATAYPPLKLTPGHYESAETYFFSSGSRGVDLTQVLLRKFGVWDPLCADGQLMNFSSWHRDPYSGPEFKDSCGCLKCPNKSARAPYLTNCLGHTLLNLSGYDVEEYLLVPSAKPRLGGWSFGVQIPTEAEDGKTNTSKTRTLAKVWYNQKGFHSLPSYLNHLNNLILWQHLPPADWRQYGITLYSHPYGGALLNEDKILESIRQCGVALCIVLGFSILSASIGSSVVRDRVTGAKRLQHISGLGHRTYWLTNFLYDLIFYLVSVSLCVAIIVAFQLTAFTFRENLVATALLLALFGYAMIPWMYLISRIFPSSDVAFISYISLNFIFGLCTMLMTTMPRLLAIISKAQNLQKIYDVLKWAFTIFPQFCLGQGLIELCYNQIKYDLTHSFGIDSYVSPFEMNFLGWIFVELTSQGTVLLLLRILLHGDHLRWSSDHSTLQDTVKSAKDVDVEKEQMRVLEGRTGGDILVLCNLRKSYRSVFRGKTTAVHDISLGIPRGECFGLLGVNGAGKSTTFKILNGETPPSSGHAVIRTPQGDMVDLASAGKVGILIGYCPQQDALDELLTGWEHLQYYCRLRGIPKQYIPEVAADLVRRLHLESHVDKPVATYSGGTRRKLSTALALVGKPDILLLDEPSSGMDPCSKRYLWQTITQEVQDGCAAVLTSHSMEECEALCTRLAIMVDGSFQCLGSPQHIKNRFGDGYTVKVWLHKEGGQASTVSDFLKLHFSGIQFKGQRLNLLEYHVQKSWECLADLFKVLENNKSLLNIKHYSISQTTLEQVFVNFATEQLQTSHFSVDPPSTDGHHTYYSHI
ncbi:ATP-binding cassette sub-family A member 13 isoform X2 [Meriones unguiculatus]|uniref:ATP-binding cassette sub-family A member 13 isoform X2 n=1 Tax=Meriones unguiculatus TaxID=10047 RepID=UPI00293EAC70|nr:ATP-binding cassette sub-family A member 13 isoform X2 [Meriones unguiculatus]